MAIDYVELENLVKSLKYGSNVVSENSDYVVTKPMNEWDMNYRLHDLNEGITYLVDIGDICDNEQQLEEYGGILYQDLLYLNIDAIKEIAWKTEESE